MTKKSQQNDFKKANYAANRPSKGLQVSLNERDMEIIKTEILILGGGLSGLAVDHFIKKINPDAQTLILEKTDRLGGAIQSFSGSGYQGEWGPHGFLNNCEVSQEILNDLDLEPQLAPLADFVRYICQAGKLECIPQNPKKIIMADLMPLSAKLRVLGDLFTRPEPFEQSMADWAAHRFGKAILPFVDAVLTGTYAGDMEKLSVEGVFPTLREMELKYGSVFKALIKGAKNKKKKGLPAMQSFEGGMEELIFALGKQTKVQFGCEASKVEKTQDGWVVTTNQAQYQTQKLALALPLPQAWPLLMPLQPAPLPPPAEAKIYNLLLGFGPEVEIPFGFGYLAPRGEKRYLLGALFSSKMFPGRAPDSGGLLECLVGGRLYPERLEDSDESIIAAAMKDLRELLPLPEEPLFAHVLRPQAAIPQPEMGHGQ